MAPPQMDFLLVDLHEAWSNPQLVFHCRNPGGEISLSLAKPSQQESLTKSRASKVSKCFIYCYEDTYLPVYPLLVLYWSWALSSVMAMPKHGNSP